MNGGEKVIEVKDLTKVYPAAARLFGDGGGEIGFGPHLL